MTTITRELIKAIKRVNTSSSFIHVDAGTASLRIQARTEKPIDKKIFPGSISISNSYISWREEVTPLALVDNTGASNNPESLIGDIRIDEDGIGALKSLAEILPIGAEIVYWCIEITPLRCDYDGIITCSLSLGIRKKPGAPILLFPVFTRTENKDNNRRNFKIAHKKALDSAI